MQHHRLMAGPTQGAEHITTRTCARFPKLLKTKKSLRCESASAENMRVFVRRLKVEPLLWVSMRQKLGGAR